MIKTISSIAAALFLSANAFAAVVTPGSFTADAIEDYESTPGKLTVLTSIFGGDVDVIPGAITNRHLSVDQGDWFDFRSTPSSPIVPNSGSKFGVGLSFGNFTLDFTRLGGIFGFSGWSSAAHQYDDVFDFFDMGGSLIDSFTKVGGFGPGDGTMEFFSFVSTHRIGSIRLSGDETAYDDFGYLLAEPSQVPEPGTLALLGLGLVGIGLRRRVVKAS